MAAGYQTINEAITAAADGAVINIGPGIYRERLILEGQSITLQASPQVSLCKLQQLPVSCCDCMVSSMARVYTVRSECLCWQQ